jgi:hypothetical protein
MTQRLLIIRMRRWTSLQTTMIPARIAACTGAGLFAPRVQGKVMSNEYLRSSGKG